jgi:hypothetical protein
MYAKASEEFATAVFRIEWFNSEDGKSGFLRKFDC